MQPENRILFACARQNFKATHQSVVLDLCHRYEIDWKLVWETARNYHVAPLVYTNLRHCPSASLGIPPEVAHKFGLFLFQNISRREHSELKIADTLALLNSKSIDAMLVKGAALNILVYDQPWYTIPSPKMWTWS